MTKPDECFELIKSLTKAEKRFFRLAATTTEGSKNYLRLFDVLDKMEEYDPKKIADKLRPHKLNISHEKKYLRRMILKALRNFHAENSPLAKITQLFHDAEILYHKGLHAQTGLCFDRIRELCMRYEYFTFYLEASYYELKISQRHRSTDAVNRTETLLSGIKKNLKLLDNRIETDAAHARVTNLNNHYGLYQSEKSLAEIDSLCHSGILAKKENMLSVSAFKSWCAAQITNCWHREDFAGAIRLTEENIRLQEEHPAIIEKEPHGYLASLYNLTLFFLRSANQEKFFLYLGKMNRLVDAGFLKSNKSFRASVLERTLNFEARHYIDNALFAEGREAITGLQAQGKPYFGQMSSDLLSLLSYNFALICFGAGDYREAVRHLHDIAIDTKNTLGQDTIVYSKILLLIIHYELGNQDMLGYLVRLFHKITLKEQESNIVRFFRDSLGKASTKQEEIAALKNFRKQAAAFQPSDYIDLELWLQSKTGTKSYAELAAEKAAKRKKQWPGTSRPV